MGHVTGITKVQQYKCQKLIQQVNVKYLRSWDLVWKPEPWESCRTTFQDQQRSRTFQQRHWEITKLHGKSFCRASNFKWGSNTSSRVESSCATRKRSSHSFNALLTYSMLSTTSNSQKGQDLASTTDQIFFEIRTQSKKERKRTMHSAGHTMEHTSGRTARATGTTKIAAMMQIKPPAVATRPNTGPGTKSTVLQVLQPYPNHPLPGAFLWVWWWISP